MRSTTAPVDWISSSIHPDPAPSVQDLDARFLVAIHQGDVDDAKLVRHERMHRGFDRNGGWVGYVKAGEALDLVAAGASLPRAGAFRVCGNHHTPCSLASSGTD